MIKRILFILVLCLLVITPIVSATTLTGTLGASYYNQTYVTQSSGSSSASFPITSMYSPTFENTGKLTSIVQWFPTPVANAFTTDVGAPNGATTTVTIRISNNSCEASYPYRPLKQDGRIVGTGTLGYQRVFNTATPPVEQMGGYMWLALDSWSLGTDTGTQYLYLEYNPASLYNLSGKSSSGSPYPAGTAVFGFRNPSGGTTQVPYYGTYSNLKDVSVFADYNVSYPAGAGTLGRFTKTVSGTPYNSQAFVYDSVGNILTSDITLSSTNFNFSTATGTLYPPIRLGIKDSLGTMWNSSLLFTPTIPTVTPTPTPVPGVPSTPADMSNITIAVKYVLNDTAVGTAYVELQSYLKAANHNDPNAWQSSLQGYTNPTTGYFQSDMTTITGYDFKVIVQKPGFQTTTEWITPSPYYYSRIIYLYADTTGGGVPTTINMTLQVKNSVSGANIANAVVTARDTIAGTSPRSAVTNATGYAVFKTFPNTANIDGTITATNYQTRSWSIEVDPETGTYLQSKDYSKVLYMATIGVPTGTQTPFPTPTPTPVSQDILSLSATPDSVSVGDNVTLVGSSSNATKLTYAGGLRQTLFYMNRNNPNLPFNNELIGVFYNVNATHWKFRANNNDAFGTPTTASPLTMIHAPQTNALYTYRFAAFDVNTKAIGAAATRNVLVGGGAGAGSLVMSLSAQDGRTTSHLMNYQLNITDDASGVVTEYGNISYDKDASLLRGNSYTLRASKSGYQSGSQQFTVPIDPRIIEGDFGAIAVVKLYPDGWITVGNCSVSVHVNDAETYYPISNVQISIPGYPIQYTGNDAESASFSIPENTAYTVTASKQGYCSVSESKNTSTDTYQYVSMMMKYGACIGVTPTHTPIPGLTPTPTAVPTPIGGVYNGTAAVCGALPENPTLMDVLRNSFACNGIVDLVMQNMALSMLIMLIGAIILGRVASGIGVLAGAIIGAVVSTAMGLLPFWIIIVLIIIAGLVFAGKIFWSNQ